MIKASFLPLLYSQKLFGTQGLFKSKVFASTGVTTQAQNQQELGLQKMQEPHEQRNRQEEKPRKHRNPQLHKSKSFAKERNRKYKDLTTVEITGKGHPEPPLHRPFNPVVLPRRSPTGAIHDITAIATRRPEVNKNTRKKQPSPSYQKTRKKKSVSDPTTNRATVRADR